MRSSGQDSATSYCSIVKNVNIRDPNKELKKNKMYSGDDVGEIQNGEHLDVRELLCHQKQRSQEKDGMLCHQKQRSQEKDGRISVSVFKKIRKNESFGQSRAFSIDLVACAPKASKSELSVLKALSEKILPSGYMDELLNLDTFHQWLRLSIDNETDAWFKELLAVTQSGAGSAAFDDGCQAILNKLFSFTAEIMRKRKSKTVSFEANAHKFYKSTEFDEICKAKLPGNLSKSRPGCMLLGMMLSQLSGKMR